MSRSLDLLKKLGWTHEKVERWISFGKRGGGVRKDLFGLFDILVLKDGFLGIQVMGADVGAHREKAYGNDNLKAWLENGGRVEWWAWDKRRSGRGTKEMIWKLRRIGIRLSQQDDFVYLEYPIEDDLL